jgi:hypothetical protein
VAAFEYCFLAIIIHIKVFCPVYDSTDHITMQESATYRVDAIFGGKEKYFNV